MARFTFSEQQGPAATECHGDAVTTQPAIECHGDTAIFGPAIECHGDLSIMGPAAVAGEDSAGVALSPLAE
ncbi:MAG: hypothetical protein ABR581_10400 [Thermoleophilaceae bacterium]